ncbi:hypothetical protein M9458_010226, partial [Cirrhinus mrigala]
GISKPATELIIHLEPEPLDSSDQVRELATPSVPEGGLVEIKGLERSQPTLPPLRPPSPASGRSDPPRDFQSPAPPRREDPLSPPPASESWTPPWSFDQSSPPWPVISLAPPDSLVPLPLPWSVVEYPLPPDSTPPALPHPSKSVRLP